jgi:tripartite motif-containing protein 71
MKNTLPSIKLGKTMRLWFIPTALAAAWLLVSCASAVPTAAPVATPRSVPSATPAPTDTQAAPATPSLPPTPAMVIWSGSNPPLQMDLVATIKGGASPFGEVRGVALDQAGDLYVVDRGHASVLKFDPAGKFLLQWGGPGTGEGKFDMSGNGAGFVAVDSQGNVYVTDNTHVQKFDSQGKFLLRWGELGSGDGQFKLALALAIDPQDNVYVLDIQNADVQKFDSSGKFLLKWGGIGTGEGQFAAPAALTLDLQGNVLVADTSTGRVEKFDSTGKYLGEVTLGPVNGLGIGPVALAVGSQGQVYIGEFANGRVDEFDSSGKLLAAWGNTGSYADQMTEAGGLALAPDGSVYVTDAFNNRVLKFKQH